MSRNIHMMGIGGVGMAGVAFLLSEAGNVVTGCDKYSSSRTKWLEASGIPVSVGHSPCHVEGTASKIDELIVTPAVPNDHPELVAARARGVRVRYRGEALAEIFNASFGIAVCGSHGKTTTSTFTAKLLSALGDDPSWCIGGECGEMPVAGKGSRRDSPFVIEADESDGTLLLYKAKILVVTNVEYDHPEHFPTVESYRDCYRKAEAKADLVIHAEDIDATPWPCLVDMVNGEHNVRNALCAIAVAEARGFSREAIAAALPVALSSLPDRRFEEIFAAGDTSRTAAMRVFDDYAHHPTELACAVKMARNECGAGGRLRVLFQPHRYSRTKSLLEAFPPAFVAADEVVLVPVYSAFEKPILGGDIADLYDAFRRHFKGSSTVVTLARNAGEAWKHAFLGRCAGDVVLLAGAGDIINLVPQVKADLAALSDSSFPVVNDISRFSFFRSGGATTGRITETLDGAHDPIVIGMGSNTWLSDLVTDRDIVKPQIQVGAEVLRRHPGLAFMAGIPGTLGGWVRMNAGAFGHSVGEFVESVTLSDGRVLSNRECGFSYRHSDIDGVIADVKFRPEADVADTCTAAEYLAKRKGFPPRTCGSVFKNPEGDFAGRLLEAVGVKKLSVGGARVWEEHANVIVAEDGCTSSDILALARIMAARVYDRFGIRLEPEIRGIEVL